MSSLSPSDPQDAEADVPERSNALLGEFRGGLLTIGWATAATIATFGWLYFIVRLIAFVIDWVWQ
jgi:hypothetical protein